MPRHVRLDDDALRAHGIWTIDSANANSWDTAASLVLDRTTADILVLQEHKVHTQLRLDSMQREAQRQGWRMTTALADSTAAGCASGGAAVLGRRRFGMVPHAGCAADGVQHRLQAAWVGVVTRGGLHVVSIWLRHSEGLSEANLNILAETAALIVTLPGPWVIAGNWNITPAMLQQTGWLGIVQGAVVAPDAPTCNNSTYDFFVVAATLHPAVLGVSCIFDAGFTPHLPVRLYLAGHARRKQVRRLVRPPSGSRRSPAGPGSALHGRGLANLGFRRPRLPGRRDYSLACCLASPFWSPDWRAG